ncbi:hypothetical protein WA026_017920 [Henosepilachna vigintioctopunctata]|uniref:Uncharacterized protein n=1 Tax=Henosepilachna vigintioctopunctata TaxID=420089 RepID=A0AAW1TWG9_9CUCU
MLIFGNFPLGYFNSFKRVVLSLAHKLSHAPVGKNSNFLGFKCKKVTVRRRTEENAEGPDISSVVPDDPSNDDSEEEENYLKYQHHQNEPEEECISAQIGDPDRDETGQELLVKKTRKLFGKKKFRSRKTKRKNPYFKICRK